MMRSFQVDRSKVSQQRLEDLLGRALIGGFSEEGYEVVSKMGNAILRSRADGILFEELALAVASLCKDTQRERLKLTLEFLDWDAPTPEELQGLLIVLGSAKHVEQPLSTTSDSSAPLETRVLDMFPEVLDWMDTFTSNLHMKLADCGITLDASEEADLETTSSDINNSSNVAKQLPAQEQSTDTIDVSHVGGLTNSGGLNADVKDSLHSNCYSDTDEEANEDWRHFLPPTAGCSMIGRPVFQQEIGLTPGEQTGFESPDASYAAHYLDSSDDENQDDFDALLDDSTRRIAQILRL